MEGLRRWMIATAHTRLVRVPAATVAVNADRDGDRDRLNRVRSPFRTAERFGIEDIIDPRDTRPLLCEFVDLAWQRLS